MCPAENLFVVWSILGTCRIILINPLRQEGHIINKGGDYVIVWECVCVCVRARAPKILAGRDKLQDQFYMSSYYKR
jgi:hypothetical protein